MIFPGLYNISPYVGGTVSLPMVPSLHLGRLPIMQIMVVMSISLA